MEQCYVAYDENVELGFDLDKTIKNIKKDFDREVKWAKKTNQKYSEDEVLAGRISYHLWKDLKVKDRHLTIRFSNGSYSVLYDERYYFTPLYFEKKGSDYFLLNNYGSEVKKGAKFDGDVSNLKKVIYNLGRGFFFFLNQLKLLLCMLKGAAVVGRQAILLDSQTMIDGGIALVAIPAILRILLMQTQHIFVAMSFG